MNPQPDEYEMALRARSGDAEALEELVARTRLRLFSLAYAELRNYEDAQDAVASALVQICLHIREVRDPGRIRAWMKSIVRNEVRRILRDRNGSTATPDELEAPTTLPSILRLDIDRALLRLPTNHAEVIRLFYLSEMPIRDVASRLGRSEGTVKGWLHRGRRQLALEMKGYAPMKKEKEEPAPRPAFLGTVALVHTDLSPEKVGEITQGLAHGNFDTELIAAADYRGLVKSIREDPGRWTAFRGIILDEWLNERPALEIVMHLKGGSETQSVPVAVLVAGSEETMIAAFYQAGVAHVVVKGDSKAMMRLTLTFPKPPGGGMWQRFTERSRRVVFFAQEEAVRLNQNDVGAEHLLLGLIREDDSAAARILDRMGIALTSIRQAIEKRMSMGDGRSGQEMQLTPPAKRVINFAYEESRDLGNNYVGSEHLLLSLIRESEGLPGQELAGLGVELERTRREIRAMHEETRPDERVEVLKVRTEDGVVDVPIREIRSIRVTTESGEVVGEVEGLGTLRRRPPEPEGP